MGKLASAKVGLVCSFLLVLACVSGADAQWVKEPSAELLTQTAGLQHRTLESEAMKTTVGYSVVLPPSYESQGDARFPVIYWLHGGGGNECSSLFTSQVWRKLYADEDLQEVILVYPNGFRSGYMDHIDGKVMVETMLIRELIPQIDRDYRTRRGAEGRAVHGFSMGASGALKFAIKYPEMFCAAVAYGGGAIDLERSDRQFVLDILKRNLNSDPALIRQNNTYHYLKKNHDSVKKQGTRFLLICGAEDSWKDTAVSFHAALREKQIPSDLKIVPQAGHDLPTLIEAEGVTAAQFQNEIFQARNE